MILDPNMEPKVRPMIAEFYKIVIFVNAEADPFSYQPSLYAKIKLS